MRKEECKVTASNYSTSLHQSKVVKSLSSANKKNRWLRFFSATTFAISLFLPVSADAAPRMTKFNPDQHGFKFSNRFRNLVISELDFTTGGLCGGMVYSALDYFNARKTIPQQDFQPAEGTRLQSYIYDRQYTSIKRNLDKWFEYGFNPFGVRNREFFNWGLQFGNGRLGELVRHIDRGQPVPLGLQSCGDDCRCPKGCPGSHQVLAIGYDLGGYKGNPNINAEDVSIFVYDPNLPGKIQTIKPNSKGAMYKYAGEPNRRWRSYFVDTKYSPAVTPVLSKQTNKLIVRFHIGDDDLRGGNDNVHLTLLLKRGLSMKFNNINTGKRWIDNSIQTVPLTLPPTINQEDIIGLRLVKSSSGGFNGDNWNLNELDVRIHKNNKSETLFNRRGRPLLFRFTGDQRTLKFRF